MSVQVHVGLTAGALLIGSWVNTAFLAFEFVYFVTYWRGPKVHPTWLNMILVVLLVADITCSIAAYYQIYALTITHFGDEMYMLTDGYPVWLYIISATTTALSAFVTETYLNYRVYMLSRSIVLVVFLETAALTALSAAIWVMVDVEAAQSTEFALLTKRFTIIQSVTTWLGTSAGTDIAIALVLIFLLLRLQQRTISARTQSIIRRAIFVAVETGGATSCIALTCLIVYLINNQTNLAASIFLVIGRVYMITLLINVRQKQINLRKADAIAVSAGRSDGRLRYGTRSTGETSIPLGNIQVQRIAITRVEDQNGPVELDDQEKEKGQDFADDDSVLENPTASQQIV